MPNMDEFPVATEEELEDAPADYVIGVVNGEAMRIPVALLLEVAP